MEGKWPHIPNRPRKRGSFKNQCPRGRSCTSSRDRKPPNSRLSGPVSRAAFAISLDEGAAGSPLAMRDKKPGESTDPISDGSLPE
jgi:hypothetical protein